VCSGAALSTTWAMWTDQGGRAGLPRAPVYPQKHSDAPCYDKHPHEDAHGARTGDLQVAMPGASAEEDNPSPGTLHSTVYLSGQQLARRGERDACAVTGCRFTAAVGCTRG
jgi:hypothetical protein